MVCLPTREVTYVTKLSVRTQIKKTSRRVFKQAIERQKQTLELRVMKKILYKATTQSQTKKERQNRKSIISLKERPFTKYESLIVPPTHMTIILPSYMTTSLDVFTCRPCGTHLEKLVHVRDIKHVGHVAHI